MLGFVAYLQTWNQSIEVQLYPPTTRRNPCLPLSAHQNLSYSYPEQAWIWMPCWEETTLEEDEETLDHILPIGGEEYEDGTSSETDPTEDVTLQATRTPTGHCRQGGE